MKLDILDAGSKKVVDSVEVSEAIFDKKYNETLIHQVLTAYMAGGRSGSKAQKNRSAVSGGGKKPFSQKGSGRARAGTTRGPIWRSGGVTFAAQPRDYSKKVNKKMYRYAIASMLSELLRQNRLLTVDDIAIEKPSTKFAKGLLNSLEIDDALFITENLDENFYLSVRNLYHMGVTDTAGINPVILAGYKNVVITKTALQKIGEWL